MKKKDHDTIVQENYTCPKNEIVGGKSRIKSKKHKRISTRQLLLSTKKLLGFNKY